MTPSSLPIWQIHAPVVETLRAGNRLVLVAPTGSGKTTQVPQMLLDAGLAGGKKIVVLQPRRVAARTVAARVAWERQCPLGAEVGYQIRFDDQTSLGTRISYVTEGILLRWLQDNRTLADVGVVIFDEFHERNLLSDVALALVKRLQRTERPDLKMAVMSATLEAEPVAEYLTGEGGTGETPVLHSEGQSFPVEVRYLSQHDERPVTEQAADVVEQIVNSGEPGDILVFMPGMGEINATIGAARAIRANERLALIPLHGDLPPEQQDLAFAPNPLRKVVVATNVAETSVTIDGIRHVVDSGLARVARYDAERGIGTLFIEPISRASAEQRKGRAGRTAPGHLPPALDRKRPVEPARAQHARDSAQRPGRGGLAAALAGHQTRRGVRLAGQAGPAGRRAGGAVADNAGRAAGFTITTTSEREGAARANRQSPIVNRGGPDADWPADAQAADASALLAHAGGGGQIRVRAGGGVVRRAGERARYADAPWAATTSTSRRRANCSRRARSRTSTRYARLSVREEEQLQRGDLPPLWHPRADGAAGGADVRADHADRASSRAC